MYLIVLLTASLFFAGEVLSLETVEYYGNLINESIANAKSFELPKSNEEFRKGWESDGPIIDVGSFDFIIVGAGAAGSVLATRLSEVQDWKILLLEAGGEENDFSKIPGMYMYALFSPLNWGYYTTPQTTCCLGMKDKKCAMHRGKAIGGTSTINAMSYVRGNRYDYDKWVEMGNPGWSYHEVLPYFKKSENSEINGDLGYHGHGGYWNVEYSLPDTKQLPYFLEAHSELNIEDLDYNGKKQLGAAKIQLFTKDGRRHSIGTAFLRHARERKNLKLVSKALVTKINIDKGTKTAQGVEFITNDKKYQATAKKEVIVSGGVFNSPQLLMLSGIGPKDHLQELGIEVIGDLPVGKTFMEHALFPGMSFLTNISNPSYEMETLIQQYLNGYGSYTSPSKDGVGFLHTGDIPKSVPMIEYTFNPSGGAMGPILAKAYNYVDNLGTNYLKNLGTSNHIIFYLILLHPKSRGKITLKSNSPIDFPNIDLRQFSEDQDIDNMITGIEFVLKLIETEAFQKINPSFVDLPICQELDKFSKQYWACALRHMSNTLYHPCGSTPMGQNPTTSVVNHDLKVHGFKKLRVVDAGVFPWSISGHTNGATVMVAEKISDTIKKENGKNRNGFLNINFNF